MTPVSCLDDTILGELPGRLFRALHVLRLYTKKPGHQLVRSAPYIFPNGSTVLDAAATIHKDFAEKMKLVRLWGSAKHEGQPVTRDHLLVDGDVIEFHL